MGFLQGNGLFALGLQNPTLQNSPKFGIKPYSQPATSNEYSLGGNNYVVSGSGYGTKVFQKNASGDLIPITGNGTAPASLQISAAISDPRLSSWLTKDDPAIKWDDLIRSTWAKDPTQALAVYGQQAARKPGGVDPTPDSAWFTDQNYWPSVMAGFDGSMPALNQSVAELGTATPNNVAALNQWRSDMSPNAQQQRNDPDNGFLGLGSLGSLALGIGGSLLVPGLGAALGGGLLGSAGAGAIIGGATSGLTGGNILEGAALGGLGAGIGNYAGSNFSTNPANGFAGISPAQFASTAGKAGLGMLSGANPGQALTNGIAGLAGTSVASNFNSPWLQGLTGSATNAAVRGGDVGQAALYGGLGGLANSASSQFSNPWAKSLIASSPQLLSQYMNMQNQPQQPQNSPQPNQQAQMPDWVKQAMVALGKKGYSEAQARQMIQQRGRG